ncbi:MAG: hypothetical protein ACK40G_18240 [Cytophagaceae bacterium]
MKRYFTLLLFGLFCYPVFACNDADTLGAKAPVVRSAPMNIIGLTANKENSPRRWFDGMRYSGFTRVFGFYRNMKEIYDMPPAEGLTLPVNLTIGDGYQMPLMLFRLEGNPSAKTAFQMEYQFDHRFLRTTPLTDKHGRYANLFVIFNLQGSVNTSFGTYKMIAGGGANWYRLSPFTLWGYQYRDDLFERLPWEPEGHDFDRYNSYYYLGDMPRDMRFGRQATQGFILEGTNMPAGFDAALLYGKTNTSGGFQGFASRDPKNMFGTRIGKMLGDHKLGFSYFNQYGYNGNKVDYKKIPRNGDTLYVEDNRISQLVTTVDGRFEFKHFNFFAEVGAGSYFSNSYHAGLRDNAKPGVGNVSRYKRKWSESLFFEITTKKELTRIPLRVNLYRIGAMVVNNSNAIVNTSVEEAKPGLDTPDEYNTLYYDGMVTEVGQLANNRQGINLFAVKNYRKLIAKFSVGIAQEIQNLAGDMRNGARANVIAGSKADSVTRVPFTNSITYEHRLNGLTRSRFAFYKRFTGPYGRQHGIFRRSFENLAITDEEINYKKSFSTFDLDLKYKIKLFGRELILTNFTSFNSVQENWSPIPVFTDKAFLRLFYEEFMAFYAFHNKITLVGFFGTERVLGNHRTELADENGNLITNDQGRPIADPNGKPIHQIGYGYGLGLDYNFHARASLHLRSRWFTHKDKNFTRDRFKGNEVSAEFNIFF